MLTPKLNNSPYYSGTTGNAMMGMSAIYTTIAHLLSTILNRMTPSRFHLKPSLLHPSDCFSLPSPSSSQSRHVAIVTGSNTGIGYQTSLSLVERGYDVILACRSRDKAEMAVKSINQYCETKNKKCGKAKFLEPLDLTSYASVRSFVSAFSEKYSSLHILVNNAGLNSSRNGISEDGLDIVFQANSLGHFLLTKLLMPYLKSAKNKYSKDNCSDEAGRIVNLSSTMHHFCKPEYGTKHTIQQSKFWEDCAKPGISDITYSESKLAAILFSMELNRRYNSNGIRAVSANPGAVNSDIWRDIPIFLQKWIVRPLFRIFFLSTKQGSQTSLAGAIGKLPKNTLYLQPYWIPSFQSFPKTNTEKTSFLRRYPLSFPMFEFMGPFIGHAVTQPRLPLSIEECEASAIAFWDACEKLTSE